VKLFLFDHLLQFPIRRRYHLWWPAQPLAFVINSLRCLQILRSWRTGWPKRAISTITAREQKDPPVPKNRKKMN
jgi:hypothetical protein